MASVTRKADSGRFHAEFRAAEWRAAFRRTVRVDAVDAGCGAEPGQQHDPAERHEDQPDPERAANNTRRLIGATAIPITAPVTPSSPTEPMRNASQGNAATLAASAHQAQRQIKPETVNILPEYITV